MLLTTLLQVAALGLLPLEFAAAIAIRGPMQAPFSADNDKSLSDPGKRTDGLRFYHRRSMQHNVLTDGQPLFGRDSADDVKLSNEKTPSHQRYANVAQDRRHISVDPSVRIFSTSADGNHDGSPVYIGRRHTQLGHHHHRSFHRIVNSRMKRSSSTRPAGRVIQRNVPILEAVGIGLGGLPGTIDIVSPTIDDPVGVKIASLAMSTEPASRNQFILNASGTNASTVYLRVNTNTTTPVVSGSSTLIVTLEVPVYDQSKASYIPYCATFDTNGPSPLMATECMAEKSGVTETKSQVFEYNPATRIIKPLWLAQDLAGETPENAAVSDDSQSAVSTPISTPTMAAVGDVASSTQTTSSAEPSQSMEPLPLMKNGTVVQGSAETSPVNSSGRSVELVFTPDVDASVPVINSGSGNTGAQNWEQDASPTDDDSTPTDQLTDPIPVETDAPSPSSTDVPAPGGDADTTGSDAVDQGQDESDAMPPLGTAVGEEVPEPSSMPTETATVAPGDVPDPTAEGVMSVSASAAPAAGLYAKPSGYVSRDNGADADDAEGNTDGSVGDDGNESEDTGNQSDDLGGDDGVEDGEETGEDSPEESSNELRSVDTGYGWRFSPSSDV